MYGHRRTQENTSVFLPRIRQLGELEAMNSNPLTAANKWHLGVLLHHLHQVASYTTKASSKLALYNTEFRMTYMLENSRIVSFPFISLLTVVFPPYKKNSMYVLNQSWSLIFTDDIFSFGAAANFHCGPMQFLRWFKQHSYLNIPNFL